METDCADDFDLTATISPRVRHTSADTFDDYASDVGLKTYLKTINADEFVSIGVSDYPSAFDHVIEGLKKKFGYGIYSMHDAIFYYGLMHLWKVLKELDIIDAVKSMDEIKKHIEISTSKVKNVYEAGGDIRNKTFKVSSNTSAFCGEIARTLGATKKSINLLAMLISFKKCEYVTKDYMFMMDSHLFEFDSKLERLIKNYSDDFILSLHPYAKTLYNSYIAELFKKNPDTKLLSNLLAILIISKEHGQVDGDLVDYKHVIASGVNALDRFERIDVKRRKPTKIDISYLYGKNGKTNDVETPDVDAFDELDGYMADENYNNTNIKIPYTDDSEAEKNSEIVKVSEIISEKQGFLSRLVNSVKEVNGFLKRIISKRE